MERYTDIIILYVYIKTKLLFYLDFSTEWPVNVQIAAHGTDSFFEGLWLYILVTVTMILLQLKMLQLLNIKVPFKKEHLV